MVYKLNGAVLPIDTAFKDSEGTSYPSNWLRNASDSEKANVPTGGIKWEMDPEQYDTRFYSAPDKPIPVADAKASVIAEQKDIASRILSATDWMVIRQADGGTNIPSDIKTYRANVRAQCKAREDQITACSDTAAVGKLFHEPKVLEGTADNGATEIKKEVLDSEGKSKDPKEYESYDPKRYEDIPNTARLKDWPKP